MSERNFKIGQRVEIFGKHICGRVAYIGFTNFAAGKWIGVILDEPKGKHNGSVKGHTYFQCASNCGVFIRPSQLMPSVQPSSQMEPTSKLTRITHTRLPLSSSRQSILGSGSQLASPTIPTDAGTTDSTPPAKLPIVSPSESFTITKRSSFVETGFLEILRPQFTLGQPIRSPSFLFNNDQQKIIDDLKAQVNELVEQLDVIRQQRHEDKDMLREFDKMKIQFEHMKEFKVKIMETHTLLQRDLQKAKREAKEAFDSKTKHSEEMSELADSVELITLDREMAEEKAETLQLELDDARERIEELSLDLEIIRNEMQRKIEYSSNGNTTTDVSEYELKQLQQQNRRLKETLIRMRDLNALDKNSIQKLTKELDMKKSEVLELHRTKEKLSGKIDELESQILDLFEQVDAAIGAEEMVEQLAEQKLELEEKLKHLEEEVSGLEAMEEIHEQLIESNNELEMDLREELDKLQNANKELSHEKEAVLESVYDRDITILKFRELVQTMNDHIRELTIDANASVEGIPEANALNAIDFNQIFAESKAFARAIDLQLGEHQLRESAEHIEMLLQFMPASFVARGSDHDAILTILLISRLIFKSNIIITQVKERLSSIEQFDKETIIQGYSVHQFAFKCRFLHTIHNLQIIVHQMLFVLSYGSPDTLLRTASTLIELMAHERTLDATIDLLKFNKLDENSSTESLERSVSFFQSMYLALMTDEELINECQLVRDCLDSIRTACDSIITDASIIQTIIRVGDEMSESFLLLQYVIENTTNINKTIKLIRKQIPQRSNTTRFGLTRSTLDTLRGLTAEFSKIVNIFHISARQSLQSISGRKQAEEQNNAFAISHQVFWTVISNVSQAIYPTELQSPSGIFREVFTSTNNSLMEIGRFFVENEHALPPTKYTDVAPTKVPIIQRASIIKKQMEEIKVLAAALESRETDIRQLKKSVKMKQSDLSEMQVRKDVAERKFSKFQHEYNLKLEKMQNDLDDASNMLKQQQFEFEETVKKLQADAKESPDMSRKDSNHSEEIKFDDDETTVTDFDDNFMKEEAGILRRALLQERHHRIKVESRDIKRILGNLEKITVPKKKDSRLRQLEKDLVKAKHEWIRSFITHSEFDKPTRRRTNRNEFLERAKVKDMSAEVAKEILDEYLKRHPHRLADSSFGSFPSKEIRNGLLN